MRACLHQTKLESACESSFEKLLPDSLTRIQKEVRLYRMDLRLGLGVRLCSEKAGVLLSSIYDAHLEFCLLHPRSPT